ncbi:MULTISPECIES: FAD-dependent oxidoreductase [Asticcacaulis]|uniref:FAD-dependent oxidoreductase n=1 Tax=Asticcacaulis TaxID=76890 RepID=UPI001FDA2302|nr:MULTISPECIES: FAD-dependent oxidoreductase [Asticcacaulis]MBP2157666.1 glycine/D-amino acid oxidase-like deaminating enzyme [Asticcacaulis solisilvae]MDR6798711.1 glycine/D-amino acid oxidase-like deaminating enzyme [Asticcacaulis sp. BE141]
MDRRKLMLLGAGALTASVLPGIGRAQAPAAPSPSSTPPLVPIRLSPDQVFRTTVCLRPFRGKGPRIETETVGRKQVVHNYGHGGSGWSLSWGSAEYAVRLAMQSSPRKIAVVGAGALGLTAALMAQRAGAQVTIYARERFPFVRSAFATGSWTPSSRVAMAAEVAPDFADRWETMARYAWSMHQSYVGLAGNPVEWMDQYLVRGGGRPGPRPAYADIKADFIHLDGRINDIVPHSQPVPNDAHPFASENVQRTNMLTFNVASLAHQLTEDFLEAGGRFVPAQFHSLSDFTRLKEKVIINCTGYGARALCKDESIVPVRGQIVWLAPQADAHYGFYYGGVSVLGRRDGVVVQDVGWNEMFGWNDDNETIDPVAARESIENVARVYRG